MLLYICCKVMSVCLHNFVLEITICWICICLVGLQFGCYSLRIFYYWKLKISDTCETWHLLRLELHCGHTHHFVAIGSEIRNVIIFGVLLNTVVQNYSWEIDIHHWNVRLFWCNGWITIGLFLGDFNQLFDWYIKDFHSLEQLNKEKSR